jgi:hypothetical protein
MWKAASKACERYATKRYEARQLLAYDPEEWLRDQKLSFEEQEAKIWRKYSTENMDALFRLRDLDVRACLRGALWTDDSINELMQKDLAERLKDSPKGPKQAKPR